jgi:uncharacterized protein YggE
MKLLLSFFAGAMLATSAAAQAQSDAASSPERSAKTISVYGTAIRHVAPNQATITIAVVTQHKDALVAQQDNATKSAAVISAVKSVGDPALEVSTGDYSIVVQHPVEGNVRSTAISGYEVTNSVAVRLVDLTKVGDLLDRATQAGANSVSSVVFGLDDSSAIRRQVLTEATADALARAQAIAHGLETDPAAPVHLRPIEVREAGSEYNPLAQPIERAMTFARQAAAPTPIEAGKLDVSATVFLKAELP